MPDRRPLRIVHTSDVHLGAYSGNDDPRWHERRQLIEAAFSRVIDAGLRAGASLLLIAGDFFDNDRVDEATAAFAAAEIARFGRPAVLLPGNHDPMDAGRVYWRHDLEAAAPNLRIVRAQEGEWLELEELDTLLWGRACFESDWHFQPLAGLPERRDHRWHIALAHGHFVPSGGDTGRSFLIHEEQLAAAADWDYLALGHWEPHADVSRAGLTAIYPGAPVALSDANRRAGWAAIVDLDANGVRWRLERVDPRPAPGGAP